MVRKLSRHARHGFCFSIWDHVKNAGIVLAAVRAVDTVETTTFELDDVPFLERLQASVSTCRGGGNGVGVDVILKFIAFLELLFGYEVIEFRQNGRAATRCSNPGDLELGRLEISVGNQFTLESLGILRFAGDFEDTPAKQDNVFTHHTTGGINCFQENLARELHRALANGRIFRMERSGDVFIATFDFGKVCNRQSCVRSGIDCHETTSLLVKFLLVFGPE
mmetsp:Transcript_17352/g.43304  ORF Transcript_17352/g.43304 Transcript_17352/m.43304 type:complete len:222 (-) Transcript_17352:2114-2779(-)